ncbi:MAG TPA: hypothetical protein VFS96_02960, partial [Nitrolancea sp.]|nr:hypothetical protein [Nitrolancea sp.]
MKSVLVANPGGARLYELTDGEFDRLEYLLELAEPTERGAWAVRFLAERQPSEIFPPGTSGAEALTGLAVDRAIGGNFFTPKWGRIRDGRSDHLDIG